MKRKLGFLVLKVWLILAKAKLSLLTNPLVKTNGNERKEFRFSYPNGTVILVRVILSIIILFNLNQW